MNSQFNIKKQQTNKKEAKQTSSTTVVSNEEVKMDQVSQASILPGPFSNALNQAHMDRTARSVSIF